MSLLLIQGDASIDEGAPSKRISTDTLKALKSQGCTGCPLNKAALDNGKMPASGPKRSKLFLLGEAPGAEEDAAGEPFVGRAGQMLRSALQGRDLEFKMQNTIRCHPPKNRDPTLQETECCRGYVEEDILEAKPAIVIGTGLVPLRWALTLGNKQLPPRSIQMEKWRGLLFPIKIGSFCTWYYPVMHPSFINRVKDESSGRGKALEATFAWDLQRALALVDRGSLPKPAVIDSYDVALEGCEWVLGDREDTQAQIARVLQALDYFDRPGYVGFDYETVGLKPYDDRGVILSLALSDGDRSFAFPVEHPNAWGSLRHSRKIKSALYEWLHDAQCVKIAHNLPFELEWTGARFSKDVIRAGYGWGDTMAMDFVLDPREGMLNLDTCVFRRFGFWLKSYSPSMNMADLSTEPLDKVLPYNALDAKWTIKLFRKQLKEQKGDRFRRLRENVYQDLQIDGATSIVLSQLLGVRIDSDQREAIAKQVHEQVDHAESAIQASKEVRKYKKSFGRSYNPASDKDNVAMFRDILKRTEGAKKNGGYSTSEKVLRDLESTVPMADRLLQFRKWSKLRNTYINGMSKQVHDDGLMHIELNIMRVITGRLSSGFHTWPRRKDKFVRSMVTAPNKGDAIVSLDYGQIDARNIAMYSDDPFYCDALWDGLDIHQEWAERLIQRWPTCLDVLYETADQYPMIQDKHDQKQLVKQLRDLIKNGWVFPLFYGSTAAQAANGVIQMPLAVAEDLYRDFWQVFKGVHKWQKWLVDFYNDRHYVETLQGRRRYGPLKINEIYNSPIQGMTAEIVQNAYNRCSEKAFPYETEADPSLTFWQPAWQVHDDLTFYVPNDDLLHERIDQIAEVLIDVPFEWVTVPIVVEAKYGMNWADQVEYKEYSSKGSDR